MTYVIGDVHGEFDSLRLLVNKLPQNSTLIFVGDLVDKGKKSKEVIEFIRKNNFSCVLGNHEEMMIDYCENFISKYPNIHYMDTIALWIRNGGKETLLSYSLIEIDKHDGKLLIVENEENFRQLVDDIKWLKTLPLYIELDKKKKDKPIVISHAPLADVWHLKGDKNKQNTFREYALWNRKNPKEDVPIFNIFGHTIIQKIDISKHYINVDTGCYYVKEGYGILSAYCIENGEVVIQ